MRSFLAYARDFFKFCGMLVSIFAKRMRELRKIVLRFPRESGPRARLAALLDRELRTDVV
jgi:hypothetical protein